MASWTSGKHDLTQLMAEFSRASIELYEGDGAAAYHRLDLALRHWLRLPVARMAFVGRRAFSLRGLAALAAYRSGRRDQRLLRSAARDARALRAMRAPWTTAIARLLEAGVAIARGARDRARAPPPHRNADFLASSMTVYAAVARRRLGELQGGADGARLVAEADALLVAQDIRVTERFARLFAPEC